MALPGDKKWELIQQLIGADAQGRDPKPLVSQRTLFGIRSSVEEQVEAIVAEVEERNRAARHANGGE